MRTNSRWKRIGTQFAFWILLIALISSVLINFVNLGNPSQLSAYDDDWDDLSAFRQDLVDMGIETRSLVSSPLLLEELEDPANTTFVISGVERDTISFHSSIWKVSFSFLPKTDILQMKLLLCETL